MYFQINSHDLHGRPTSCKRWVTPALTSRFLPRVGFPDQYQSLFALAAQLLFFSDCTKHLQMSLKVIQCCTNENVLIDPLKKTIQKNKLQQLSGFCDIPKIFFFSFSQHQHKVKSKTLTICSKLTAAATAVNEEKEAPTNWNSFCEPQTQMLLSLCEYFGVHGVQTQACHNSK